MSASFVPDHKASMVLFLDRVYGIENQDFLLHVLDVGFLPDMRAAASLDTVSSPTKVVLVPPHRPEPERWPQQTRDAMHLLIPAFTFVMETKYLWRAVLLEGG